MALTWRQRHNACLQLLAVQERAHHRGWGQQEAHHMAVITTQCALAESNLHNYGNKGIAGSYELADKRPWYLGGGKYMGTDHASVGTFQQQVPMWGTLADCMNPREACHKFMHKASEVGVDTANGLPNRLDIQKVQVSYDWNGWNYYGQRIRARIIVSRYWDDAGRRLKPWARRRYLPNIDL